jgi:hypothetical protein
MYDRNVFVISSPLLKRQVLNDTQGFFEGLNWVEDWDFYFRCFAQNYQLIYDSAPDSLSLIRVHPKSLSRNKAMMMEQSLIARGRIDKLLSSLTGFEKANFIRQENIKQICFLHRLLVAEYQTSAPEKSRFHFIQFALKKKDYKLLIKGMLQFAIGKKVTLAN